MISVTQQPGDTVATGTYLRGGPHEFTCSGCDALLVRVVRPDIVQSGMLFKCECGAVNAMPSPPYTE
jgi:hypothetical protein